MNRVLTALANAEASVAAEGLHLEDKHRQLILKVATGEVTQAQFIQLAIEMARRW